MNRYISTKLLLLLLLMHSISWAAEGAAEPDGNEQGLGAVVGIPQILAVTYDKKLDSNLSMRLHAGSLVLLSSVGARLQWGRLSGALQPYLFAGGTIVHSIAGDFGDPDGSKAYLWFGAGLGFGFDRYALYLEAGGLGGGDPDRGLGSSTTSAAVGLLVRY